MIPDSRLPFPGLPYAASYPAILSNSDFEIYLAILTLTRSAKANWETKSGSKLMSFIHLSNEHNFIISGFFRPFFPK